MSTCQAEPTGYLRQGDRSEMGVPREPNRFTLVHKWKWYLQSPKIYNTDL